MLPSYVLGTLLLFQQSPSAVTPAQSAAQSTSEPRATDKPAAAPKSEEPTADRARLAFDRLKALAGDWEAKSTKGWTERSSYQLIANGSVIMEVSYGAHPNDWMATMYHLDGPRLLLTHYCAARNQPRLWATEISPDGGTITFTFLDATNLPSRDTGHMDKCKITLADPDHFRSQWTWYAEGKESWMEEIEHLRAKPAEGSAATASPFEDTKAKLGEQKP